MKASRTLKSSTIRTSASGKLSQSTKYPPMTQKSKEDEYIASLQKQVYYLELEMKLMKDRELETKNKVGGYEVLFRDGVPLNEHFLALKTKYTNEKEHFENMINGLMTTINNTDNENQNLQLQIERTNKSYYDIIQHYSQSNSDFGGKIFDINGKLFNEINTLTTLNDDKNKLSKDLFKFTSENVHHNRTIEKNNLFKEDVDEKNEKMVKKPTFLPTCPLCAHFFRQKWPGSKPTAARVCGFRAHFPTFFLY